MNQQLQHPLSRMSPQQPTPMCNVCLFSYRSLQWRLCSGSYAFCGQSAWCHTRMWVENMAVHSSSSVFFYLQNYGIDLDKIWYCVRLHTLKSDWSILFCNSYQCHDVYKSWFTQKWKFVYFLRNGLLYTEFTAQTVNIYNLALNGMTSYRNIICSDRLLYHVQ